MTDYPVTDVGVPLTEMDHARDVLFEVLEERGRQIEKWRGWKHDDTHCEVEWRDMLGAYVNWAWMMWYSRSLDKARRRLIQVAALAVAAVQAIDRSRLNHDCDVD